MCSVNREFVLSALGAYCHDRTGKTKCLDAFGASGILGLLWKQHVKLPLEVTINDVDPHSVSSIKANCVTNGYTVTEFRNTPEEELGEKCIEISESDANVLMHRRQYNFICIDPFGTTVQFLDSTFKNVFHKGMVVLTSTDIATLYGKCPQVLLRNYGAFTVRTDYTKEMAVRILLAEAARSAAKCNKGFDVVYSLAVEHFVQVGLKIRRGANHGNQVMSQIGEILHCRHCQEWGRLPSTNAPRENPYQYLPCRCHSEKPGQTAVVLGPMWLGEIFNSEFLQEMRVVSSSYKLSERAQGLLQTMQDEAKCLDCVQNKTETDTPNEATVVENTITDDNISASKPIAKCNDTQNTSHVTQGGVDRDDENRHLKITTDRKCVEKRLSDNRGETDVKKSRKTVRVYSVSEMPVFYYNLHARGIKKVDVPKVPKLLVKLHSEGFRASRTAFDIHAVRTNATVCELAEVLVKYYTQK